MSTSTPTVVRFARPKCFCGYTAVSIYPDPDASRKSTLAGGKGGGKGGGGGGGPLKANWVYECHFTPKQRAMIKPNPCEDCEEARQPRSTRSGTSSEQVKHPTGQKRHTAPLYDEVEIWSQERTTTTTETTNNKDELIGAMIGRPSAFYGLSPLDHLRVCGFHMHSLEWHHMQTVGIDQIIALAGQTRCEVFNLSVMRWLGDKIRKSTRIKDTAPHLHLDMRLFHKMGCLCKKEVVLAWVPTPPLSNRRHPNAKKEYWIVCRARAQANRTFEIADRDQDRGEDLRQKGPFFDRRKGQQQKQQQSCSFGIPLEIANFGHNRIPIHVGGVETNDWLSRWLLPPRLPPLSSLSSSSQPPSSSSSLAHVLTWSSSSSGVSSPMRPMMLSSSVNPFLWDRRHLDRIASQLQPPLLPWAEKKSTSGPGEGLVTAKDLEHGGWPWSTTTHPSHDNNNDNDNDNDGFTQIQGKDKDQDHRFVRWDEGAHFVRTESGKVDNRLDELRGVDRELDEVLARHIAAVGSRINNKEARSMPMERPMRQEAGDDYLDRRYYKEFDTHNIPDVSLHVCKECNEGVSGFAVIPRFKASPLPPSPPGDIPMDQLISLNTDADKDEDDELERLDKELQRVMTRHAEQVQRTMEGRARMISQSLQQCGACGLRRMEVDVLPCCHMILCGKCLDRVEFYVVPRRSSQLVVIQE
ncbi:hypothetical protein BGX29_002697 [Mortierella sp. GBA35]|nr:hypothetical protein BGX29_002697 [Mortierella sp. GBA35]